MFGHRPTARPDEHGRRRLHRWGLLTLAVVSGAMAGSIVFSMWVPASAIPSDCDGRHSYHVLTSPGTNGRGVRVFNPGMFVKDTNPDCARASTISVVNSNGLTWTEAGWYDEYINVTICVDTSGPKALMFKSLNGVWSCSATTPSLYPPAAGDWEWFSVSDANQDGVWQWVWNGQEYGSANMGTFVTGDPRSNAERKSSSSGTSNYVDHYGLYRMGSGQAWYGWSNVSLLEDTDPNYHRCWYSSQLRIIVKKGTC
jgi:hypothetical protein